MENKSLVIMESPTKAKAVQKYLGDRYLVMSSGGHIRNLAKYKGSMWLGVNLDDFEPIYELDKDKKPLVAELKKAASTADKVYLATDPDREGEAIAYHLNDVLGVQDKSLRVTFNEVTKAAVLDAFAHPHQIDYQLVESQEARRILDRLIGFRLSRLLQKKIKSRSAGRVQSVALKLVVDREASIKAFKPEEYWTVVVPYNKDLKFELVKYQNKKIDLPNKAKVDLALAALNQSPYVIDKITHKSKQINPPLPLKTATLFQLASLKYNFSSSKTALLAQQLYEGINKDGTLVGFISYPRTDSTRIAPSFINSLKTYISNEYGSKYLTDRLNDNPKQSQKNVQDAHEAIRPTDVNLTPKTAEKYLTADQFKVYQLIYNYTVAAFMSKAEVTQTTVVVKNGDYELRLSQQKLIFLGFMKVLPQTQANPILQWPDWQAKQTLSLKAPEPEQHFTKPPARYTEAKLIKTLEDLGIGRPSTYAPIIRILKTRNYIDVVNKAFVPTEKGILTNEKLQQFFKDIINEKYTSKVEAELDEIANGSEHKNELLRQFWNDFEPKVEVAFEKMPEAEPRYSDKLCPLSGDRLVYREGRFGPFWGCSAFPKCRYIEPIVKKIGEKCPECKTGDLIIKTNKRRQKFIGCSNYPTCTYTRVFKKENVKASEPADELENPNSVSE